MLLDTALRYSLAASLAYKSPECLAGGGTEYARRLAPTSRFAEQVNVEELSASCTLFNMVDEDGVVVAFRGSTALRNYQSMFNLLPSPSRLGGPGKIHRGYQEIALQLYSKLSPALERRSATRTVFVGHSYGGGAATLCGYLHGPDEVVTFAGPRVGDGEFAADFDRALGARTTHIVHDLDPILAQNQPLWDLLGFVHTGRLLRCAAAEPRLLRDGEPPLGLPVNFADHALYLGTTMGL